MPQQAPLESIHRMRRCSSSSVSVTPPWPDSIRLRSGLASAPNRSGTSALMRGEATVPDAPVFIPVRPIAVRESTAPVSQAGLLIRRAQQFINKNACKGIGVDDVARHLGVSRRLLYLRFREIKGVTPFEAIRDRRLEAVRHRLLTTHETVAAIAADCGFESATHLMHLFKRRFGVTMQTFRTRNR